MLTEHSDERLRSSLFGSAFGSTSSALGASLSLRDESPISICPSLTEEGLKVARKKNMSWKAMSSIGVIGSCTSTGLSTVRLQDMIPLPAVRRSVAAGAEVGRLDEADL